MTVMHFLLEVFKFLLITKLLTPASHPPCFHWPGEDLLTSIPPHPLNPRPCVHTGSMSLLQFQSARSTPLSPSFFAKKRQRLLICQSQPVPLWRWREVHNGGPGTSGGSLLGEAWWLTRQVVSQSADSRDTLTVDLEDNGPAPAI